MRDVSFFPLLWRVMLAISLVAGPVVPVSAAPHGKEIAPEATADGMPCHGDMSPEPAAPPANKAPPCDDGCCPQPDCDPGACRVAGPLIATFSPLLAAPAPQTPVTTTGATRPPSFAPPPLLRPPIA